MIIDGWRDIKDRPIASRQEGLLSDGKQFEVCLYSKFYDKWMKFPSLEPITIKPLWWIKIDIPALPHLGRRDDSHN